MVEITTLLNTSIYITSFMLIFSFCLSIYSLYLNWKQSKVRDQMDELIKINKAQLKLMEEQWKIKQ